MTQNSGIVRINSAQIPVNINDNLTDDLLVEILQRIPCTCVIHAKSVCRRWHSVISDTCFIPSFNRYHEQLSNVSSLSLPVTLVYQFIFWHRHLTEDLGSRVQAVSKYHMFQNREFNLDFLPCFRSWERHPIWVVASSNDLLVCCDTKMSLHPIYYICNPLTKEWVALPPALGYHRVSDTAIGLIVSNIEVSKLRYTLVRVPELDSNPSTNQFEAEVFCSETGEWTKLVVTSPRSFRRSWQFKPDAIVIGNKLHWLINSETILVFDPLEGTNRSCRVIDLPSELNPQITVCLGSCQGHLKVCQVTCPSRELLVWELRDNVTENWHMECKISLKDLVFVDNLHFHNSNSLIVEMLAFHPSDCAILYLKISNQILMCNVQHQTHDIIGECLVDSTFSVGTSGVFLLLHPSWPSVLNPDRSLPRHNKLTITALS